MVFRSIVLFLVILTAIVSVCVTSEACSVFRVVAADGTIISGRTMEFGYDLNYAAIVVPRGVAFSSPAPGNKAGLKWRNRYGYAAINIFGREEIVTDGLNEAGLAFSTLWYETDMKWQDVSPQETGGALASTMTGAWILGSFSTVADVKREIAKLRVFGNRIEQMGIVPTAHFIVYDAKGGCIVIEYDNGRLNIYDNPLGIMTNAPGFPYMITNLRNYTGMTPDPGKTRNFSGVKLLPTGHGAGMFGLPGDLTPPSRFVRLAVMTHFADIQKDARGTLNLAQHIVSALHIVKGMIVDKKPDGTIEASETTQWSSFRDLTNRVLYFRTYDNFTLRKIDLKRLDLGSGKIKSVPMTLPDEAVVDMTDRLRGQ